MIELNPLLGEDMLPVAPQPSNIDDSDRSAFCTDITFSDDATVELSWAILVNPKAIIDALTCDSSSLTSMTRVIVPLLPEPSVHSPDTQITIQVGSERRTIHRYAPAALEGIQQFRGVVGLDHYLCVEVSLAELKSLPVFQVSHTFELAPEGSYVLRGGLGSRPVALASVPIDPDPRRTPALRVSLPGNIDCDEVMIRARLDLWRESDEKRFNKIIHEHDGATMALRNLKLRVLEIHVALSAIDANHANGIKATCDRLASWTNSYGPPDQPGHWQVNSEMTIQAHKRLLQIVKEAPESIGFIIKRDPSGELAFHRSGENCMEYTDLTVSMSDRQLRARRRQNLFVGALALLQLYLAWRLLYPLSPSWPMEMLPSEIADKSLDGSREVLVAILLLFPALLYADVAAATPQDYLRRMVRVRFAWVQLSAFAAPLVCASATVGLPNSRLVAAALAGSAGVALVVLLLSVTWVNRKALAKARRRALARHAAQVVSVDGTSMTEGAW